MISDPSGIPSHGGGEKGRSTPTPILRCKEEDQGDYKALGCSLMPGKLLEYRRFKIYLSTWKITR